MALLRVSLLDFGKLCTIRLCASQRAWIKGGQRGGHQPQCVALSPSHPQPAINLLGYNMLPPRLLLIYSADPLLFDVQ